MGELKTYLTLLKKVQSDESLMKAIEVYEDTTRRLQALLKDEDYDAAEAIRLTNDAEYLSDMIRRNPTYSEFAAAKETLDQSMAARIAHTGMPGCNCSACRAKSNKPIYGEEV